jgi:hypothetical protein
MKAKIYNVLGHYIPHETNSCLYGSGKIIKDTHNEDVFAYIIVERYHTLHLKRKDFEEIQINLPDTKNDIKDIVDVYKRYGKYVAVLLVDASLPEQQRKIFFEKALWMNSKLKNINKYPDTLLNLIPVDDKLAVYGDFVLDVVKLDNLIRELFPNIIFSTSMKEIVRMMFGKIGVELIEKLI